MAQLDLRPGCRNHRIVACQIVYNFEFHRYRRIDPADTNQRVYTYQAQASSALFGCKHLSRHPQRSLSRLAVQRQALIFISENRWYFQIRSSLQPMSAFSFENINKKSPLVNLRIVIQLPTSVVNGLCIQSLHIVKCFTICRSCCKMALYYTML